MTSYITNALTTRGVIRFYLSHGSIRVCKIRFVSTGENRGKTCLVCKTHLVLSYPKNGQRRLWSDWANAQADLNLRWAHISFVGFVMRRLICIYIMDCLYLNRCKFKYWDRLEIIAVDFCPKGIHLLIKLMVLFTADAHRLFSNKPFSIQLLLNWH